jgi:hypothetical protein
VTTTVSPGRTFADLTIPLKTAPTTQPHTHAFSNGTASGTVATTDSGSVTNSA